MNQDDFRQLLASREPPSDGHRYGGKRNLTEEDLATIKKLSLKKSKKTSKKPKNATPFTDKIDRGLTSLSVYRDRAAERRRGDTKRDAEEEFQCFHPEESNVSGGNREVKGLDYAFLAQLKQEKEKLLAEKQKLVENQVKEGQEDENRKLGKDKHLTFKTRMGKLVYFHACSNQSEPTTAVKSELFLPGRMYYTFNLSSTEVASIPVSVQRSKEDCPEPDEVLSGIVDDNFIDRVAKAMTSKEHEKKRKKMNKKKKEETPSEHENEPNDNVSIAQEASDDEDIFPDVGEYIPVDQRTDNDSLDSLTKNQVTKTSGYFSNLSASITEKEAAARQQEDDAASAWKATLQKAVEAQRKLQLETKRREKEAKMTGGDADDYAEYQTSGTFGPSDDEDDEETTRRRKAAGLKDRHRKDLDEHEKVRRKKQKQQSKLANDLEKINKLLDEKGNKPTFNV